MFEVDPLPWQCSERGRGVEQPFNAKISFPEELPSQRWSLQMCREHETWLPAGWFGPWCQHPCFSLCLLFLMSLSSRTGSLICQGMSARVCVVNLVLIRMITFFSKHVVPAQRQSEQGQAKFSFLLMRGTDFGESWLRTSCHRGNYLATLEMKCHMWLLHIVKILLSIGICQQAVWKEVKWLGCL